MIVVWPEYQCPACARPLEIHAHAPLARHGPVVELTTETRCPACDPPCAACWAETDAEPV